MSRQEFVEYMTDEPAEQIFDVEAVEIPKFQGKKCKYCGETLPPQFFLDICTKCMVKLRKSKLGVPKG